MNTMNFVLYFSGGKDSIMSLLHLQDIKASPTILTIDVDNQRRPLSTAVSLMKHRLFDHLGLKSFTWSDTFKQTQHEWWSTHAPSNAVIVTGEGDQFVELVDYSQVISGTTAAGVYSPYLLTNKDSYISELQKLDADFMITRSLTSPEMTGMVLSASSLGSLYHYNRRVFMGIQTMAVRCPGIVDDSVTQAEITEFQQTIQRLAEVERLRLLTT